MTRQVSFVINAVQYAPDRISAQPGAPQPSPPLDGFATFVALAWGTTWLLSWPLVSSQVRREAPSPLAFALAGFSAFGPSFAAFVVARRQGRLREVFGRFRAQPLWLLGALLLPLSLHLIARLIEHALGGEIARWFWLPQASAQIAALFFFSVGEEFGWRGFAHPRLSERFGPVLGPLLTGLIWGIWHLAYVVTPGGTIEIFRFGIMLVELMLWGVVIAWLFERTGRSMAVAIAVHAGAHLDNSAQIPRGEWRLQALVIAVSAIAALFAARSLRAARVTRAAPRGTES